MGETRQNCDFLGRLRALDAFIQYESDLEREFGDVYREIIKKLEVE
jgi:hypothetical protein